MKYELLDLFQRLNILGPIEGDDLSISIWLNDLTKNEASDIIHELSEIFEKQNLRVPISVSNENGRSVFSQ